MLQLLLFVYLGVAEPVEGRTQVRLVTAKEASLDTWTLKSDDGSVYSFDEQGRLFVVVPNESVTFEVVDGDAQTRFVGVWADYQNKNEISLHINGDALNLTQVVSASRISQDAFTVPVEVEVIRPQDAEERAATQTSDWLKEQAEVMLQKTNLGGGSPIMRGMSGNRILLMVDGFRINNGIFRLGLNQYLNTVPGDQLQQIEVLSGPSGVQYGSDGLGGTIHLRSADPASLEGRELAYHGFLSTADGTNTHRVSGRTQVGDFYIQGHFRANRYEDLEAADPVGAQDPTGYNAWDTSFNITWAPAEDTRLRFINAVSAARHVPRTDRILSGRDLLWEYHPQDFNMHGLRYETRAENALFDFADLGVALMRQKEGNPRISTSSPDVMTETLTQVNTLQANGTFTKAGEHFSLVYGFDGSADEVDASGSRTDLLTNVTIEEDGKFPNDAAYQSLGLFLMGEWNLDSNWQFKGGLRQSFIKLEGTLIDPIGAVDESYEHLTPSLSAAYQADGYYLSLSANQGFRAPNLEDALSLGPSNRGFDAPNPNLEPEDVWNYELNGRVRLGETLFQGSFYTARYESLIERVSGTWLGSDSFEGEPVFILDNVGKARVDGVSLALSRPFGKRHSLRGDASYVYGTQTTADVPMTRIPPLRGNFIWQYQRPAWRLVGTVSWANKQDRLSPGDIDDSRIPEGGTPGYTVAHLRARYTFNERFSVNLGLENLTDKLYKQHGSGIYEPGRRAVVEVDARWQ